MVVEFFYEVGEVAEYPGELPVHYFFELETKSP